MKTHFPTKKEKEEKTMASEGIQMSEEGVNNPWFLKKILLDY